MVHRHEDDERELAEVEAWVERLRAAPGRVADPAAWAGQAGVAPEELDRLCRAHFHATPAELIGEARLAAAGRRLVAGDTPASEVASAVGFTGSRPLDRALRQRWGLAVEEVRRLPGARAFSLRLPADFRQAETLAYLGRDPESLTERVDRASYRAGVRLAGAPARLELSFRRGRVEVAIHGDGKLPAGAAVAAHGIVRRRLGLAGDPAAFEAAVAPGTPLAGLVARRRGLRIPLTAEPFEALLWAILGQQINLAFARRLVGRLVARCGHRLNDGLWVPPTPAAVAALAPAPLLAAQFSARKVEYLLAVAGQIAAGTLPLDTLAGGAASRAERALLAVRGLGPWSACYWLMRGAGFADCVPWGDAGLLKSLAEHLALPARPDLALTRALMAPYRPYRSLATFHLWHRLEDPG